MKNPDQSRYVLVINYSPQIPAALYDSKSNELVASLVRDSHGKPQLGANALVSTLMQYLSSNGNKTEKVPIDISTKNSFEIPPGLRTDLDADTRMMNYQLRIRQLEIERLETQSQLATLKSRLGKEQNPKTTPEYKRLQTDLENTQTDYNNLKKEMEQISAKYELLPRKKGQMPKSTQAQIVPHSEDESIHPVQTNNPSLEARVSLDPQEDQVIGMIPFSEFFRSKLTQHYPGINDDAKLVSALYKETEFAKERSNEYLSGTSLPTTTTEKGFLVKVFRAEGLTYEILEQILSSSTIQPQTVNDASLEQITRGETRMRLRQAKKKEFSQYFMGKLKELYPKIDQVFDYVPILVKKLNISDQTAYSWIKGQSIPRDPVIVKKLAKLMGRVGVTQESIQQYSAVTMDTLAINNGITPETGQGIRADSPINESLPEYVMKESEFAVTVFNAALKTSGLGPGHKLSEYHAASFVNRDDLSSDIDPSLINEGMFIRYVKTGALPRDIGALKLVGEVLGFSKEELEKFEAMRFKHKSRSHAKNKPNPSLK